jgi:hypothetical protein
MTTFSDVDGANMVTSNDDVVTLTLGSRPKQGLAKVQANSEARELHFILSGV